MTESKRKQCSTASHTLCSSDCYDRVDANLSWSLENCDVIYPSRQSKGKEKKDSFQ